MLRLALPNKGALSEEAVQLFRDAGYRCRRDDRELLCVDREHEIEFVFLRPRDIAVYVGNGILDLGLTGRDLALDSGAEVEEFMALNFGRSSFCYAAPGNEDWSVEKLAGKRIATSYPLLVEQDLAKRGLQARIIRLDGAVEISIRLGVADAIADVVQSGRTLEQAGLRTMGKPVLESEAILVRRKVQSEPDPAIATLTGRLQGILLAREYVMVEYDLPKELLETAIALTPGIEAPTLSPLSKPDWVAVKAMSPRKGINLTMDRLKEMGAKGIIAMDLRFCRL